MSRTDKDDPWWVQATWWEPVHWRCGTPHNRWFGRGTEPDGYFRKCDLPPVPVVKDYLSTQRRSKRTKHCVWEPVWDEMWHYPMDAPPRWFRQHVYEEPTRTRVRDDCIEARKEYRGTGEVDVIPPIDQHKHCAGWLWW